MGALNFAGGVLSTGMATGVDPAQAINFGAAMAVKYGASGYYEENGAWNTGLMVAGEFVGTTPVAEGIYGVDLGGGQLSSFQSGERTLSGALQMAGVALALYGGLSGSGAAEPSVVIAPGAGYESGSAGGTLYTGGYDPAANVLYLGDTGHANGMAAAGGTPVQGATRGVSVVVTPDEVVWSADSPSLPGPQLTPAQISQIGSALQRQFGRPARQGGN
jgi:hypothetical protein